MARNLLTLRGRKAKLDTPISPAPSGIAQAAPGLPVTRPDADAWPSLWWLAAHGGAGATTVTAGAGIGVDAGGSWPTPPDGHTANVVLVARASASGLWAASGAIEQTLTPHALPDGIRLLGVAVVAASPGKPPRLVSDRLALLSAWTSVWTIGWTDAYLAATTPGQIGTPPPDLARLTDLVTAALETPQPLAPVGEKP